MNPAETGLFYVGSRYYDPNTGRFLNADGLVSTGQGLNGCNMFAYCGNNPVVRSDPSGCLFTAYAGGGSVSNWDSISSTLSAKGVLTKISNHPIRGTSTFSLKNTAVETGKNAAEGVADNVIAKAISKLPDYKYWYTRAGSGIGIEVIDSHWYGSTSALKCASKVGIASVIALGLDVGFDIHDYVGWDLAGAIAIDTTGLALGVLAGVGIMALIASAPVTIPAAVGIGAQLRLGLRYRLLAIMSKIRIEKEVLRCNIY